MVKITAYALRTRAADGKQFVSLQLEGDPVFVQSMETGRFYLTAKKCSITSTFTEDTAKGLIGRVMPGSIVKVQTEPYDYTIPETGEVVKLAHTFQYSPEETSMVQQPQVFEMV